MAGLVAQQLGVDVEQVLDLVRAFSPGVSRPGRTQPGHWLQTEHFKIVFEGVTEDGENNRCSKMLETLYDWTDVMKKVLGASGVYGCLNKCEDMCKEDVTDWLATYDGWGLLS